MTVRAINLSHFRMKLASAMQKEAVNPADITRRMESALAKASPARKQRAVTKMLDSRSLLHKKREQAVATPARPGTDVWDEFFAPDSPRRLKMKEVERLTANRDAYRNAISDDTMKTLEGWTLDKGNIE